MAVTFYRFFLQDVDKTLIMRYGNARFLAESVVYEKKCRVRLHRDPVGLDTKTDRTTPPVVVINNNYRLTSKNVPVSPQRYVFDVDVYDVTVGRTNKTRVIYTRHVSAGNRCFLGVIGVFLRGRITHKLAWVEFLAFKTRRQ